MKNKIKDKEIKAIIKDKDKIIKSKQIVKK